MNNWVKDIDNDWVKMNLADISHSHTDPNFVWDAQGFVGIISFAESFIILSTDSSKANKDLNTKYSQKYEEEMREIEG